MNEWIRKLMTGIDYPESIQPERHSVRMSKRAELEEKRLRFAENIALALVPEERK